MAKRTGDHFRHRQRLYDEYESVCWLCGKPNSSEIDHVIPFSQGGSDAWANLRLAHKLCNVSRNRRDHKWHKAPLITEDGYPTSWHDMPLTPDMWRDDFAAKEKLLAAERAEKQRIERGKDEQHRQEQRTILDARKAELTRLIEKEIAEEKSLTEENALIEASGDLNHGPLRLVDKIDERADVIMAFSGLIGAPLIAVASAYFILWEPSRTHEFNGETIFSYIFVLGIAGFLGYWVFTIGSRILTYLATGAVRLTFKATPRGRQYLRSHDTQVKNKERINRLTLDTVKVRREVDEVERLIKSPPPRLSPPSQQTTSPRYSRSRYYRSRYPYAKRRRSR